MLKNDYWIATRGAAGMIEPFEPVLVRRTTLPGMKLSPKVISYGLSSFGYDIRLSPEQFKIFRHVPGTVIDPKNFNPENLEDATLHHDPQKGNYFILPAHSYALGVALERLDIPENISVLCIGKSTYARCGIIANLTPAEAGWKGYLTLEFSNSSGADCRMYTHEGVVQLLFMEGERCITSYADRMGKYQNQKHEVTLAKV